MTDESGINPNEDDNIDVIDVDGDSYSNPIDLIPPSDVAYLRKQPNRQEYYQHQQRDYDENYSNPVDMVHKDNSNDRRKGLLQTQQSRREDEIYVLPVLGHGQKNEFQGPPQRPTQLDLKGPLNRPAVPRAHIPEIRENIAAMIDPTYPSSSSTSGGTPGGMGLTPNDISEYSDQSSSPVPPYMPIQGQRRNIVPEGKKKKSKDKCTHQ